MKQIINAALRLRQQHHLTAEEIHREKTKPERLADQTKKIQDLEQQLREARDRLDEIRSEDESGPKS